MLKRLSKQFLNYKLIAVEGQNLGFRSDGNSAESLTESLFSHIAGFVLFWAKRATGPLSDRPSNLPLEAVCSMEILKSKEPAFWGHCLTYCDIFFC